TTALPLRAPPTTATPLCRCWQRETCVGRATVPRAHRSPFNAPSGGRGHVISSPLTAPPTRAMLVTPLLAGATAGLHQTSLCRFGPTAEVPTGYRPALPAGEVVARAVCTPQHTCGATRPSGLRRWSGPRSGQAHGAVRTGLGHANCCLHR